jgi:hypothetical protein
MQTALLIGSGRFARHLQYWVSLHKESVQLLNWNRKSNSIDELNEYLKKADFIWLAISDSSLLSFYEQHLTTTKAKCIHFSGAFHDERLVSAHPLMSFPDELMKKEVYPSIHFALTGVNSLTEALPHFLNSYSLLPPQDKAFYHALCVITGNFPQLLWSETLKEFEKIKIPHSAIEVYINQITANFIQLKQKSLTGPFIRKDFSTINKNLQALATSKLKLIYQKFVEVFT